MNLTQPQQFEVCGKSRKTLRQLYSQISQYIFHITWIDHLEGPLWIEIRSPMANSNRMVNNVVSCAIQL